MEQEYYLWEAHFEDGFNKTVERIDTKDTSLASVVEVMDERLAEGYEVKELIFKGLTELYVQK
ncbi:hypothetical protein [Paenisporosarcina cavernae]|uniref:Uncharacterized protein n=1 Tax=Paenisporosarcina cavernae TaxID=2320858 RepID=A0A385YT89_9BACL|nr:hypothetical protein [Paenisporosarcina cavernae]AYC28693.1 hypothetical protein D3873_01960 [Paenisporosarcina cavernae]